MTRLLKIALREYLSYVRTVGFWLSMARLPVIMGIAIMAPTLIARSAPAPAPNMAIIDLSGRNLTPVIIKEFERQQSVRVAKAMAASATAAAGPKAGEAIMASFNAQGLKAAEASFTSLAPKVAGARPQRSRSYRYQTRWLPPQRQRLQARRLSPIWPMRPVVE